VTALSDAQHLALVARAAPTQVPPSELTDGIRNASTALRTILETHAEDRDALVDALRGLLAEGAPGARSRRYEYGWDCVLSDVEYVLENDRHTIAELLDSFNQKGRP
jgi:hypothetical protein